MPEQIKHFQKEEVVYVQGYGKITFRDVFNSISKAIDIRHHHGTCEVLSNHSAVISVPETVDIFNLGSMVGQKLKDFNIAVIYPPFMKENYELFKKAGNKRGANIKLFEHKKDAVRWISGIKLCLCKSKRESLKELNQPTINKKLRTFDILM